MRSGLPHVLLGAYVVAAVGALTWPGYTVVGEGVEPRILGLPFAMAWHGCWIVATCIVLFAYDAWFERRRTAG